MQYIRWKHFPTPIVVLRRHKVFKTDLYFRFAKAAIKPRTSDFRFCHPLHTRPTIGCYHSTHHHIALPLFRIHYERDNIISRRVSCPSSSLPVEKYQDLRQSVPINPGSFAAKIPPDTADDESKSHRRRTRKLKVAVLVGYVGCNYAGLQMVDHPVLPSVQSVLERAMYESGHISSSNYGAPRKVHWRNSGRTDKGVHAAGNVISLKVAVDRSQEGSSGVFARSTFDRMRNAWNVALPDDVRVLDVAPVKRNFDARIERDRVRYVYLLPSFVLNAGGGRDFLKYWTGAGSGVEDIRPSSSQKEIDWTDDLLTRLEKHCAAISPQSFRISDGSLVKMREILGSFVGSHSFHNYTVRSKIKEARTAKDVFRRYITKATVQDPIIGPDGTEWLPISIVGQSFMYNQIRKMVGMAANVGGGAETLPVAEHMARALDLDVTVDVPTAPSGGLFMDVGLYRSYNNKIIKNSNIQKNAIKVLLDWGEHDNGDDNAVPYQKDLIIGTHSGGKRWKQFREGVIIPHIIGDKGNKVDFLKFMVQLEWNRKLFLQ